jgi:hypothetical protein
MADPRPFAAIEEGPIKGVGPAAQDGFIGLHQVYFQGATGLVGSAFGVPGVTVTRTGTGAYSVSYPKVSKGGRCAIIPGIEAPTGFQYDVSIQTPNVPNSGTFKFNITKQTQFLGSGAVPISGTNQQVNPVSGTVLNLLFFGSPNVRF